MLAWLIMKMQENLSQTSNVPFTSERCCWQLQEFARRLKLHRLQPSNHVQIPYIIMFSWQDMF